MKRTRWTKTTRANFFRALAATGIVNSACEAAGVGRSRAFELRKEDPEFAAEWEVAEGIAADRLETEARRRAIEGVDDLVVSRGEVVMFQGRPLVRRVYSDRLMELFLRAKRPQEFSERQRLEHSGPEGAPIQLQTNLNLQNLSPEEIEHVADIIDKAKTGTGSDR